MKLVKFSLIFILIFIIVILSAYIVITDKPSLLKIPINFYLKKYNISSNISRINIKSPRSFELSNFSISKKGTSLHVDFLRVLIDKSGKVSLLLINPDITIRQNRNIRSAGIGHFKLPFAIGRINIKNLNLKIVKNSRKIANLTNMNIAIGRNSVYANGHIKYLDNGTFLNADIKTVTGVFHLSKKGIVFDNIIMNSRLFWLQFKNTEFKTKDPVKINNLYINFNPFRVEIVDFKSAVNMLYGGRSFSFDMHANIKQDKSVNFLINLKGIRSKTNFLTSPSKEFSILKPFKVEMNFAYFFFSLDSLCIS